MQGKLFYRLKRKYCKSPEHGTQQDPAILLPFWWNIMPFKHPILNIQALGFPWVTRDPFLFCVYHLDHFPKGKANLAPDAALSGRNMGQDFENKDGWNMYHGEVVPGFPNHPHRGFETVTVVRQGIVDHSDSLGGSARYGNGDTQWMTAGAGISHSEMFPMLNQDKGNPLDLFQIWLNLPADHKMSKPAYKILWDKKTPRVKQGDTEIMVVAGSLEGQTPPAPPPDSWASVPGSQVSIWVINIEKKGKWTLPAAEKGLNRNLYFYKGASLKIAGQNLELKHVAELASDSNVEIANGSEEAELLLLQGRPIGEPVANYGPFVMNTQVELEQAFADYQRTRFGGWPWKRQDPVHAAEKGRFALFHDGKEEKPDA